MSRMQTSWVGVALTLCLLGVGCDSEPRATPLKKNPRAARPDALGPGENLPGRERVFGLEVPDGFRVASRFPDSAYLNGHGSARSVAAQLQKQLVAQEVQLTSKGVLFPRAYVARDASKRVFRIEVANLYNQTQVRIRDITPPPVSEGLTEPERWERAGRNPDGTLKDRSQVY